MSIDLPLDKMTVREKLDLMEQIWADLSKDPSQIPVYDWQKEELDRRRARAEADPSTLRSWDEVKRRIREECPRPTQD
ncbi:MAG: addiction module protein [Pirellulales bacterium]|nr:addiction module protein [Pirellulales bacterium]